MRDCLVLVVSPGEVQLLRDGLRNLIRDADASTATLRTHAARSANENYIKKLIDLSDRLTLDATKPKDERAGIPQ
jgi:hypothetical protein